MIDSRQIRILMADFGDSPYKPSQDEIIYEFKYVFPKETLNRGLEIVGILINVVALLLTPILYVLLPALNQSPITPVLYGFICALIVCFALRNLFVAPRGIILLSNKGMYIKGAHQIFPWHKQRFYKYGDFGVRIKLWRVGLTNKILLFTIYDIHTEYSFFAGGASSFAITQNDEIQNMREFLTLLREKTQEALEAQGKAECYNLKEKIQYKPRKDF